MLIFVLQLIPSYIIYITHFQKPILHTGKTPSKETVGATDGSTLKCEPNFLVADENCILDVKEEESYDVNETCSDRIVFEDSLSGINVKQESLDYDSDTHLRPRNEYGDTQKNFMEDNINGINIKHENLDNESDMQLVDQTVHEDILPKFLEADALNGTHIKREDFDYEWVIN